MLGHSAHNSIWTAFSALSVGSTPLASEYLAGESGVLVILGYAALGGWLMHKSTRKKDSSEALPTAPEAAESV